MLTRDTNLTTPSPSAGGAPAEDGGVVSLMLFGRRPRFAPGATVKRPIRGLFGEAVPARCRSGSELTAAWGHAAYIVTRRPLLHSRGSDRAGDRPALGDARSLPLGL